MTFYLFHKKPNPYSSFVRFEARRNTLTYVLRIRHNRFSCKAGISLRSGPHDDVTDRPAIRLFSISAGESEHNVWSYFIRVFGLLIGARLMKAYAD